MNQTIRVITIAMLAVRPTRRCRQYRPTATPATACTQSARTCRGPVTYELGEEYNAYIANCRQIEPGDAQTGLFPRRPQ